MASALKDLQGHTVSDQGLANLGHTICCNEIHAVRLLSLERMDRHCKLLQLSEVYSQQLWNACL